MCVEKSFLQHSPIQVHTPCQAPMSYLEHTHASPVNSGVPSKSALPALGEMMASPDTGHSVIFTCASSLLLNTFTPFYTHPTACHLLCQTTGKTCISEKPPGSSSCLVRDVGLAYTYLLVTPSLSETYLFVLFCPCPSWEPGTGC